VYEREIEFENKYSHISKQIKKKKKSEEYDAVVYEREIEFENKSSHISKQMHVVVQQKAHVKERKNIKNRRLPMLPM
jgi:hypothetical protein